MAKYGKGTQKLVKKNIDEFAHQGKWQSKKQAIAVGLSEAREEEKKTGSPAYKTPPQKKKSH